MLEDQRILLTGGTGLIGSHIIKILEGKNELFCLRRSKNSYGEVQHIKIDLSRDFSIDLLPEKLDCIFHIASPLPNAPPQEHMKVNVLATLKLLEFANKQKVKSFVFASTGSIYGYSNKVLNENAEPKLNDINSVTKYQGELLLQLYDLNTVALRYFFPYGIRERRGVVHAIATRVLEGKKIILNNENANPLINPIYAEDVAEATVRAAEIKGHEVLNVAGEEKVNIQELALLIGEIAGKAVEFDRVSNPAIKDMLADTIKMKSRLDFEPKFTLRYGLTKVVEYMKRGEQ